MNNNSEKPVRQCVRCHKTLRAIGTARVGGKKTHGDWSERELHKKCWMEVEAERRLRDLQAEAMERLRGEPLDRLGWVLEN